MAHQHPVKDTDLHFVIDPVTRVVKNNSGKIVIMQHDHQSEILTFELPRYIDTHDMSLSNTVRVHYINIGASSRYTPVSGVYEVNDLQVDATNENLVTCSWTLTNNATQLEGTLNFIIRFSCLTGDTIDYSWSTAIYSGIIVAKTIDSSDYVMTAIPDILEQWKESLKGDPFTYEDFTPEQLEGLRGPAGIIISETEPTNEDHPVWIRPSGEYIVENLGLTGATVGQIVKIKTVDSSGVPTGWESADMPSGSGGGTDTSLGLTGAIVGQTVKIKAVDATGVPTEWEAADAASGEDWEFINEISTNEWISSVTINQDSNGNPFSLKKMRIFMTLPKTTNEAGEEQSNAGYAYYAVNGMRPAWQNPSNGWNNALFLWTIEALGDYYTVTCFKDGGNGAELWHSDIFKSEGAFSTITKFEWRMFNVAMGWSSTNFKVYGVKA